MADVMNECLAKGVPEGVKEGKPGSNSKTPKTQHEKKSIDLYAYLTAMEKSKIPEYLLQITESYFTDRWIVSEGLERKVYASVPAQMDSIRISYNLQ
ncbi:hypothetical protein Zmor_005438 [Zophobas morio]|uniref:Uncharacterized protein n=1 Tax=Zophobas morio TaxID=2755281 RepID=A0AA38IV77_9CUCU|nr:hypothetical protein Zmor_005438 [Zophobas morio]